MGKKIHFVHLDAGPGGMEVLLPKIIKHLKDRMISVFVLRSKQRGISVYDGTGISVTYGNNNNVAAFLKAFSYAYRNRNDNFHVYNIGPVFLFLFKLAGVKKIIYSLHGTIYWKTKFKKRILYSFWQMALSPKIIFIANSLHSKSEFLKKVNAGTSIRVVYNPIDENLFIPPVAKREGNEILVIYCGRLENGKNLTRWIECAVYVHAEFPQTRFELYGDGSLKDTLQNQIIQSGAEEYIQLKSFRSDIENVYVRSDLLMFLSEYESFGNVVVESILCGTPVVALPIPAMQEIFNDFQLFLLKGKEQIEEQICNKIRNLEELKSKAALARDNFVQRFGLRQHINSLQEIYGADE